jgi:opine dehydrogenase
MKRITVLGGGAGGCASAAILTHRGYSVTLWNRWEEEIRPIIQKGGIECAGDINGFVKIDKVTLDIEEAVKGAELISIPVPIFAHRDIAELCAVHLEDGQIILLNPGSVGSLEFAKVLKEKEVKKDVTIAESITLAVGGGRVIEPGKVRIRSYESWVKRTAAFPGKKTERIVKALKDICNPKPAKSVLEVGLLNVNFIIHAVPLILNIGSAELDILFNPYRDGVSPSILRCIEHLDTEKQNILKVLGVEPISCDDIYRKEFGVPDGIPQRWRREEEKKRGRGWEERYISEDVQYGLVLFSSLGHQLGVPTPITDAMVELGSVITKTNLWETGRTVKKLGISSLNLEQVDHFFNEGELKKA